MAQAPRSFGGYPRVAQAAVALQRRDARLPTDTGTPSMLAFGNGRSYGDVCLNADGCVLLTRALDRFIAFDRECGVLRCEAGVMLSEILDLVESQGWQLPVVPGTQYVTVGGAIANDVHGKNHHRRGSFGEHVLAFELLRSDGTRHLCRRDAPAGLFAATVAGLGLTGLITWAELQLVRRPGTWLRTRTLAFRGIGEFLALSSTAERECEHVVAWIDGAARGVPRGLLQSAEPLDDPAPPPRRPRRTLPLTPPLSLVNGLSVRAFNALYYARGRRRGDRREDYRRALFPLDGIAHWNRIYGPRGFLQFQCVVPEDAAESVLPRMLARIADAGSGSFLAVLKRMAVRSPAGLLSFPRAGVTLAIDLPLRGASTLALMRELEALADAAGGALYPAKDACMSAAHFQRAFPRWRELREHADPAFSSSFWRRVTETT